MINRFQATAILLLVPTVSYSAGFDCRKASTLVEQLICRDKKLSALDDQMALAFKSGKTASDDPERLRFEQRQWIENIRDACTSLDCLYNAYDARLAELASGGIRSGGTGKPGKRNISGFEVPLIESGGVYEVPVLVNGVLKINFIIDSGASDVAISSDVALTLVRTGTITDADWLPGANYRFADGSIAKSERFKLRTLRIGNRTLKSVSCSIGNSIHAPMLLGQSALKKLGGYRVDYGKGLLILE
jgi:aspartyl protease family protein